MKNKTINKPHKQIIVKRIPKLIEYSTHCTLRYTNRIKMFNRPIIILQLFFGNIKHDIFPWKSAASNHTF